MEDKVVIEYYDNSLEMDKDKEYKLEKRVSTNGALFLYFKSIDIDLEKEELKEKVNSLDSIIEELMLTILNLIP